MTRGRNWKPGKIVMTAQEALNKGIGYFLSYMLYDNPNFLAIAEEHIEFAAHIIAPKWFDFYNVEQYN